MIKLFLLIILSIPTYADDFELFSDDNKATTVTENKPIIEERKPILSTSENKELKIIRIGIIVSVVEESKANLYLDYLLDIATKHDLEIGDLIFIGSPAYSLKRKDHSKFLVRGGNVIGGSSVPEKYKSVTSSPAYILGTDQGEIILETSLNPNKFISATGNYLPQN